MKLEVAAESEEKDDIVVRIVSSPTREQLMLSPELQAELARLYRWQEESAKVNWVIGEPIIRLF